MSSPGTRASIVVTGMVQGVFFRASARDAARRLGVTGWVKNRYDGNVEVIAEGSEEKVKAFIDWCRKGPPSARVKDVQVDWGAYTGEFPDFRVRF